MKILDHFEKHDQDMFLSLLSVDKITKNKKGMKQRSSESAKYPTQAFIK
jgi:hypothetical protein